MNRKDFSSVSPSAKSLLLMKAYTNIPYMKDAAALMHGAEVFDLDFNNKDLWFWLRVLHFENRYWSVDQLLKQTGCNNILELSSGYSMRGVDICAKDENVHYIDTDLPDVVHTKQAIIDQLHLSNGIKGKFELEPLNALDEQAFNKIAEKFQEGPLTIVNEGLLMYLNRDEKKLLCEIIHGVLRQRGGFWITADIYVKLAKEIAFEMPKSESERAFFEQHNIEENKFESIEDAKEFFAEQGFEIAAIAKVDYQTLSSLPNLINVLPEELRRSKKPPPQIQHTWMLKVSDAS